MSWTAAGPVRERQRSGRGWRRFFVTVLVIVVLLVVIDFGARAAAQDVVAAKLQEQGHLPAKPGVSIEGFPFLTQVAAKDFSQVHITAANVPAGPVTISAINATARQTKLASYRFSSGTITSLDGTALISFASLSNALTRQVGVLGQLLNGAGLKLTDAGPSEVRATLNLVVTSGSATWRVSRVSGHDLRISLVGSSGLPSQLTSAIQTVNFALPPLPLGLTIDSVSVSTAGVVGQVSGHDVAFGS